jgi:predicted transcriptional regulator
MKALPDARTTLAFGITTISLIGITILSAIVIISADTGAIVRAQSVFTAVLPLFGTWVGTVLAYYFSRENFEAASRSTQELVQLTREDRLRSTPIAGIMTKEVFSVNDKTRKVADVFAELQKKGIKRLPVLGPSAAVEALLYADGIGQYLLGIPDSSRAAKAIADMLAERPDLNQKAAFVSESASLADAKSALEKITNCKVVFVTKSGTDTEPLMGLLTTSDIAKFSLA